MHFRRLGALATLTVLLSACGGGGGNGSAAVAPPTTPPAPTVQPAAGPTSAPTTVVTSTQASVLVLPPFNGISGTIALGGARINGPTMTIASGAQPAAGVAAFTDPGARTVLAYVTVVANGAVTYPAGTLLTVTVPAGSIAAGQSWYLAVSTGPGNGWFPHAVSGAASGTTVTFSIGSLITFDAGTTYSIALYQG